MRVRLLFEPEAYISSLSVRITPNLVCIDQHPLVRLPLLLLAYHREEKTNLSRNGDIVGSERQPGAEAEADGQALSALSTGLAAGGVSAVASRIRPFERHVHKGTSLQLHMCPAVIRKHSAGPTYRTAANSSPFLVHCSLLLKRHSAHKDLEVSRGANK